MSRKLGSLLCLLSAMSFGTAFAATPAPVAYVYVSTITAGSFGPHIYAYSAAANGQLTAIPGSPFADSATSMAVNGKYLFAVNQNFLNLDTYLMNANGSLKKVDSLNDETATNTSCTDVQSVILDHSGANLYVGAGDQDCAEAPALQSFLIVKASGALNYLSSLGPSQYQPWISTFTANNVYGYGSACGYGTSYLQAFKRGTNGSLIPVSAKIVGPTPPTGVSYCDALPQADTTTHLAAAEVGYSTSTLGPTGNPDQIASYTVDGSGGLTTTSTYANMPKTAVLSIYNMSMSPSGKLLAVGGHAGLQIFHFNGAAPVTVDTGLLTNSQINQLFWDKSNHLYAISYASQKLFVFTITATSAVQAPGSPYHLTNPSNLIVQPK